MWSFKTAGAALVLLLAAACGFQPLYGERGGRDQALVELAAITVEPIADRLGQVVRNELRDRLTPRGVPVSARYRLTVLVATRKEAVAFNDDESVTRFNFTLRASYSLTDAGTGKVIVAGSTRAVATFNIVLSEFANIAAEDDARTRAARGVSAEIWTRLGVFFSQRVDEQA